MNYTIKNWLLLVFILIPSAGFTQSFNFKVRNTANGLVDNDINALVQDKNDYVWMGSDEGLIRYDGIDDVVYTTADSLANNYINCLHLDKKGRLWVGHKNGLISYRENAVFNKLIIPGASQLISDISEDNEGNIWALDQKKGIIRIDNKDKTIRTFFDHKKYGRKNYTAIYPISANRFLIGTAKQGLFIFDFDFKSDNVVINKIPDIPNIWINTIVKSNKENKFWIGTRGKGFYAYTINLHSDKALQYSNNDLCRKFSIEDETITDIYEEAENHLLLATKGSGVIRLIYDPVKGDFIDSFKYSNNNGLSNNDVEDILRDREGNYWFGTKGGGVSFLVNQYFVFYNLDEIGFPYKAHSVLKDGENLWIGLEQGIVHTDPMCFDVKYFDEQYGGIPNDKIIDLIKTNDNTIWVATANNGLFYKKEGHNKFQQKHYYKDISALQINDISFLNNQIFIATKRGLFIINLKTNAITTLETTDGLSHNNINFVYIDRDNNIWVGPSKGGINKIDLKNSKIERHPLINGGGIDVTGMTEDLNGYKWITTKGKGVISYDNDSVRFNITTKENLLKDYCYSIACDEKNRLWVCHEGGISRINAINSSVKSYGYNDNLGSEFHQVVEDKKGNVWFASNEGVVNYIPKNDKINTVAPILTLTKLQLDDTPIPISQKLDLSYPYGKDYYKLRIDFRAISFKNPHGVRYEFKIDEVGATEEEKKWTRLDNNYKEIDYLRHGNYKIRIRAFNADGKATSLLTTISINIEKPFWLSAWFLAIAISVVCFAIYLLIKFREKALIKQKQKLQQEVAIQTIVLREQKADIERKNRDITDSINYAQKIQSSILPSMGNLINEFPESFVYFAPRDIVSGDFYWFNKSKDYFVACCADCTGHGVPGAFMSMIGTTILNDIFRLPEIDSPSNMLERLDAEVKKLLQKNEGNESIDGMDISIIEVHLPSRKVRLASAKRPVYLIINNEITLYKGSRRSIGDSYEDSPSPFMNIEYNCSKGDQIYMFSDGYTDQFGGPLGKKFMKVGVQNLIEEIHVKPGAEQFEIVKRNFENWRGNLEQIDDVLFMSIKL